MHRPVILPFLLALTVLFPTLLPADAADDLIKMKEMFMSSKSWHAEEHTASGKNLTLEYSAPDRYRIQVNPDTTYIVVGENIYMLRNGHATKLPFGGGMIKKMIDSSVLSVDADIKQSARDMGMQTIEGQTLHAYSFTTRDTPVTVYVGPDNLPVETTIPDKTSGTTTVKYSKFNEPITITIE